MKAITVKSGSGKKISQPVQKRKAPAVETVETPQLTDEEMAAPGRKPTAKEMEEWLAKGDGEKYEIDEAFTLIRKEFAPAKNRNK